MSKYTGVSPVSYAFSLLFISIAVMMITMWIDRNIYDWPAIYAKLDRLEELESKAAVYETMHGAGVGVWCGLAVHYDWLEEEDYVAIDKIIDSGVHDE